MARAGRTPKASRPSHASAPAGTSRQLLLTGGDLSLQNRHGLVLANRWEFLAESFKPLESQVPCMYNGNKTTDLQ